MPFVYAYRNGLFEKLATIARSRAEFTRQSECACAYGEGALDWSQLWLCV